jgi:hypothetical protein
MTSAIRLSSTVTPCFVAVAILIGSSSTPDVKWNVLADVVLPVHPAPPRDLLHVAPVGGECGDDAAGGLRPRLLFSLLPPELPRDPEDRVDRDRPLALRELVACAPERPPVRAQVLLVVLRAPRRPVAPDREALVAPTEPLKRAADVHPRLVRVAELVFEGLLAGGYGVQRRAQAGLLGGRPRRRARRLRAVLAVALRLLSLPLLRQAGDGGLGRVGGAVVRVDQVRPERRTPHPVLDLLVDEAGQAHHARQVVGDRVAGVVADEALLQRGELVERAALHQPVHVPAAARRLDDDVRLGVELLRQRAAVVDIDEERADADDVRGGAAPEVGLVDGHEHAGAARLHLAELGPALGERAVELAPEVLALAGGVVVEGLECPGGSAGVERGQEPLGFLAVRLDLLVRGSEPGRARDRSVPGPFSGDPLQPLRWKLVRLGQRPEDHGLGRGCAAARNVYIVN